MGKRSPEEARIAVRLLQYPNREVELEMIQRVDTIIFDKVRQVEAHSVERAHRFMDVGRASITAAADLANAIEEMRNEFTAHDGPPDSETAERFEQLVAKSRAARQSLVRHAAEAEFHATTCADPMAAYVRMTDRFIQLRPEVGF